MKKKKRGQSNPPIGKRIKQAVFAFFLFIFLIVLIGRIGFFRPFPDEADVEVYLLNTLKFDETSFDVVEDFMWAHLSPFEKCEHWKISEYWTVYNRPDDRFDDVYLHCEAIHKSGIFWLWREWYVMEFFFVDGILQEIEIYSAWIGI